MIQSSKRQKKGLISEEDISTLLPRYSATTVLALLQEVFQFEGAKIDWNALVKKTSTGISNAREYQMLWRHLAYRHNLLENLEDGAQLLDDDSDLEYELEAFPSVTSEASTEAAACVKVLIASGLPSDSSHPNSTTVEAPLTINIPNGQSFRTASENSQPATMRGMNITVPVSVQKQPLPPVTSTEVLDANGSASGTIPPRRKRKPWTDAEDMELIALVQKFGEGNWANIVRGDYTGERTASQLSQRWSTIRKRHSNLNLGANSSGVQLSEAQRAARHAMNLALDPPAKNTITNNSGGTALNNTSINRLPPTTAGEALPAQHQSQQRPMATKPSSMGPLGSATNSPITLNKTVVKSNLSSDPITACEALPAQRQSQQRPTVTKPSSMGPLGSATNSTVTLNKTLVKSNLSSDPVRAAAVAAGARIGTQSDAASLLKAAQAKNVVHIMPAGSSSIKSSIAGGAPTHLDAHCNFRYISPPVSTCPAVSSSRSGPSLVKVSSPRTQHNPSTSAIALKMLPKHTRTEFRPKQGAKTAEGIKISGSEDVAKKEVQEDGACVSGNEPSKQVQEDKAALLEQEPELKNQVIIAESSNTSQKLEMAEIDMDHAEGNDNANNTKNMGSLVKEGQNESAVLENGENQSINDKQVDLPSKVTDECSEKLEAAGKAEAENGKLEVEG